YIGGHERENGHIGLAGPIVPARLAEEALDLLLAGYAGGSKDGETVRDWALRIGKEGMTELIEPVAAKVKADDEGLFFDYGEDWEFTPPAGRTAECAAGVLDDDLQRDLADDALINIDRALMAGAYQAAARYGADGFRFTAQRLRILAGLPGEEDDADEVIVSTIRTTHGDDAEVMAALERITSARAQLGAAGGGKSDAETTVMREALAYWIDMIDEVIARPQALGGFEMGALDDSGGGVAGMIKNAPGGGT
ncbi:MAG: hypothetical protein V3T46_02375, partial [Alphaproteobacteria bacterium]